MTSYPELKVRFYSLSLLFVRVYLAGFPSFSLSFPFLPLLPPPQEFDALLSQVVEAKKLSASKMNKLTEMALELIEVRLFSMTMRGAEEEGREEVGISFSSSLRSLLLPLPFFFLPRSPSLTSLLSFPLPSVTSPQNDTYLVTSLYRLHRNLAPSSPQKIYSLYCFDSIARACRSKVKKGIGAKIEKKGTFAGFLQQMEGILDGLVEDLVAKREVDWVEGRVSCLFFLLPGWTSSPLWRW